MKRVFSILLILFCANMLCEGLRQSASAQEQRIMNKPYIDNRRLHWGFYLGMNMQTAKFENTGYIDPETGEQWYAEQDRFDPGFSVGVLGALRLNKYMELRFSPGISFGQKHLKFHEQKTGRDTTQNMRCNYLTLPIELKVAAPRCNNFRPYALIGVSPVVKLNDPINQPLRDKRFDCMIELGLGCDIYLRYFKLIPEIKFCLSVIDVLNSTRDDLEDNPMIKFTKSVDKMKAKMFVFSLYFE
ncbi:MAG: PorT family protein [Bacteroidaceae bacterium]|nr:PorT family protein [Bacteroidaceae bacterium]